MNFVTDEMRKNEPFRWCIYCNVDCSIEEEHLEVCATNTHIYPVRKQDLGECCPNCDYQQGMSCGNGCGYVFKVGDSYMHRTLEEGNPLMFGIEGASVELVLCMDCAWNDTL